MLIYSKPHTPVVLTATWVFSRGGGVHDGRWDVCNVRVFFGTTQQAGREPIHSVVSSCYLMLVHKRFLIKAQLCCCYCCVWRTGLTEER